MGKKERRTHDIFLMSFSKSSLVLALSLGTVSCSEMTLFLQTIVSVHWFIIYSFEGIVSVINTCHKQREKQNIKVAAFSRNRHSKIEKHKTLNSPRTMSVFFFF